MTFKITDSVQEAKTLLDTLSAKYGWTVWATQVVQGGYQIELLAIVEVRLGKIIKIKSGGTYFMVEGESGGWYNLDLLDEVRKYGQCRYQIVGKGPSRMIASREGLEAEFEVRGIQQATHVRRELHGQPLLSGYAGPMYNGYQDGVPVIRYEG